MARFDFGGTLADFVVTSHRLGTLDTLALSAATLTMWSAQSGGTRYTDLALNGSTVTSISVGPDGQVPKFQGPDGVTEMWADGGSARIRIVTLQGAPGPAGKDGQTGPQGLPGVNAVPADTAVAGYVKGPGLTLDALFAMLAVKIPWIEAAPAFICGDSYGSGGSDTDAGYSYFDRFCARHRTKPPTNVAVSGTRSDQILMAQVETAWTPNTRGLFCIADVVLNDCNLYPDNTSTPTTAGAFRSILARAHSRYVAGISDTGVTFGPGWSSGATSTVGSYVDVSFNGDSCWIRTTAVTGAGGTFTVKNTAGTVVATITTGGFAQTFVQSTKISGFGAGNHTVRVALASGSGSFAGMTLPAATPPLVVWVKPGGRNLGNDARIAAYEAACAAELVNFPSVIAVDMDGSYNSATMMGPSNHPNDLGNGYITNLVEKAVALNSTYRQGLNRLTVATAGADAPYTPFAPSYTATGSTAPLAPTSPTATAGNQVNLSATAAADGGSTITGYEWQASLAGAGTWSTVATVSGGNPATTVPSGLTPSTSYDFRVRAINAIGNGAYSATVTATVGSPATTWSADTFTRADSTSLGSTETGGFAWTQRVASTFSISGNKLAALGVNSSAIDVTIDDGHNDGTWSFDINASGYGGIEFCLAADNSTGYLFFRNGAGALTLAKRTSISGLTNLWTGTTTNTAMTLSVVKNGSSITPKVNGVAQTTVTDATYTGTRSGLFAGSTATTQYDNWVHTSILS